MAIIASRLRRGRRWELENVLTIVAYVVLTVWAVLALFPMYWMFKLSFEPPQVIDMWPPRVLPWWGELSLENYIGLTKRVPIFRWLLNSGLVTVIRTTSAVFCGTLAGYTFAKLRFLGREVLFWMLVSVIMIPGFVLIIPQYQIIKAFKWYDTYWALIVPGFSGGISAMFLMRQFMRTLPTELMESARMDGASEFTVFLRIMLPLAKPGMAVLAIFWFIGNWNAFIWPLVVTSHKLMRTLPVGLALLTSPRDTGQVASVGQQMAGASIAAIPVIIVFLFFQRYFLKGITIGAIKG
jgi:multiple sugar transport system permease protein